MARRQAIHYKQTAQTSSLGDLRGKPHFHFCVDRECRLVYHCTCTEVRTNERCHLCRGLRRPLWIAARDPKECCIGNCVLVTDVNELVRYTLAGPGPWFQCSTCARATGWPCA